MHGDISIGAFALLLSTLTTSAAAFSAETGQDGAAAVAAAYNPSGGGDLIKNGAGVAYLFLVGIFLYRVLTRRARRAKEEKLAGQDPDVPTIFSKLREKIGNPKPARATALSAFLGAAQAGLLAAGMLLFTTKLTSVLDGQSLPDAYTARNISITVRTILSGLAYLATFIFSANSVGLLGLSVQLLLDPNSLKDEEDEEDIPKGPQLPRVSVLAKPGELTRAFELADKMGRKASATSASAASSSSTASSSSASATAGSSSATATQSNVSGIASAQSGASAKPSTPVQSVGTTQSAVTAGSGRPSPSADVSVAAPSGSTSTAGQSSAAAAPAASVSGYWDASSTSGDSDAY